MTNNDPTSSKTDLQGVIRYRLRHSPQSAFAATRPGSMAKVIESTRVAHRLVTRPRPFPALVIGVAALAAAASLGASRPAAAQAHLTSRCSGGLAVASACQLIARYFDVLNRGNAAAACSLLGSRLLSETGGSSCPSVLAPYRGTPFEIINARTDRTTVLVRVRVGLHELDHWRLLNWTAVVGTESGTLKILDTRRVT
jgi:hypothetical protein